MEGIVQVYESEMFNLHARLDKRVVTLALFIHIIILSDIILFFIFQTPAIQFLLTPIQLRSIHPYTCLLTAPYYQCPSL